MEEYPRNLTEFEALFATEEACRQYLYRLRWPDGFRCPRCGGGKCWPVRVVLLQCVGCGHQTSVTAGTIFQDTRTSLKLWFYAMWWVTTQKNGASNSPDLSREELKDLSDHDPAGASIVIFSIAIRPDLHGQGLSRPLLGAFLLRARQLGKQQVL